MGVSRFEQTKITFKLPMHLPVVAHEQGKVLGARMCTGGSRVYGVQNIKGGYRSPHGKNPRVHTNRLVVTWGVVGPKVRDTSTRGPRIYGRVLMRYRGTTAENPEKKNRIGVREGEARSPRSDEGHPRSSKKETRYGREKGRSCGGVGLGLVSLLAKGRGR